MAGGGGGGGGGEFEPRMQHCDEISVRPREVYIALNIDIATKLIWVQVNHGTANICPIVLQRVGMPVT